MKLTAAKCPSCGAAIEVNKELEKTICQYCGTTVLIEDAIAKLKIELSGKVEVDGIKGREEKYRQALKHYKAGEYNDAILLCNDLMENDKFDVDAYILATKVGIGILDSVFDETSSELSSPVAWKALERFAHIYNRVIKIDEEKKYEKELKKQSEKIDYYLGILESSAETDIELIEYVSELNDLIRKVEYKKGELIKAISDEFGLFELNRKVYKDPTASGIDHYDLYMINRIGKDGTFEAQYRKNKDLNAVGNPDFKNLILKPENKINYIEEIEEKMSAIRSKADLLLEQINKEKLKKDKKNKIEKNIKIIKLIILGIYIIALGGWTISLFVSGHWVSGILVILFIDSWLLLYPAFWFIETIDDLKE